MSTGEAIELATLLALTLLQGVCAVMAVLTECRRRGLNPGPIPAYLLRRPRGRQKGGMR